VVSAVATEHLARPAASVLTIIGSGVQARSRLEALRLVRDFREVRVWSPRRAQALAEEHYVHAYSPKLVEGVFSEVHIHPQAWIRSRGEQYDRVHQTRR